MRIIIVTLESIFSVFERNVNPAWKEYEISLRILISCLNIITDLADEYQRLVNSYRGIELAEVITAIPLDDEDKQMLVKRLSAIFGKRISLQPEVDPAVIGGFIARVGDRLLDGSTRGKLEALKKELIGTGR